MNYWAGMLAEVPATLQRLIARSQRISLPRRCGATERHLRLRQALCHARTVRATYAALDPQAQAALQTLRSRRGGITPSELQTHYGQVRSWRQMERDPRPQSVSERLVLLGWLLPRPATPRHPAHYLVPPEVRRWMPQPLCLPSGRNVATAAPVPVLRVTTTILLACAEQPLPMCADGSLRAVTLRHVLPRLAPITLDELGPLVRWLLPLLRDQGLVAQHGTGCVLMPAGQRFLAQSLSEQRARLEAAWLQSPRPDSWIRPFLPDRHGIDWPLLRRRLCSWVEALPAGVLLDTTLLYDQLAATLGPLADAHTHGFRYVQRVPWQRRRAATIFQAALAGPLTWLGYISWPVEADHTRRHCVRGTIAQPADQCWQYGTAGQLYIPHTSSHAALLHLLPFAHWQAADEVETHYLLTPASIAHGISAGWGVDRLWQVLDEQLGPAPAGWRAGLEDATPVVQIEATVVLRAASPALLDRATAQPSVRRHLTTRVAPGVALVAPEEVTPLVRALERHGIATERSARVSAPAPVPLTEGECGILALAYAFYREHAPSAVASHLAPELEQQLQAGLTPALQQALGLTLADDTVAMHVASNGTECRGSKPRPEPRMAEAEIRCRLQMALSRGQPVALLYEKGGAGQLEERLVQPLTLQEQAGSTYLRAYCYLRQAERTFRIDRMHQLSPRPRTGRGVAHRPG